MTELLDRPAPDHQPGAQGGSLRLRGDDGTCHPLPLDNWAGGLDRGDRLLVARVRRSAGPVLDVGCGPGRFAAALHASGLPTLGIDVAPAAVRLTRRRGAAALPRSIFDSLPLTGGWQHILLIDGNVGIGGDPEALLRRCRSLLAPGGHVHVELGAPGGASGPRRVRLETAAPADVGPAKVGQWFWWGELSVCGLREAAAAVQLRTVALWSCKGRWFGDLVKEPSN